MILNIIDRRGNVHRWLSVDAIIEATWHDNCPNGDQAPLDHGLPDYAGRKNISLSDAVTWASSFGTPLTLYIYDEGSDAVVDWPAQLNIPD